MKFKWIDTENWRRKPYFEHYYEQVRCTYSMTASVDITLLLTDLRSKGIKLYPALIHMITTVVNRHSEFRTCVDEEGKLGYWESMSPSFTVFHEEDKSFSTLWTPYSVDFHEFYAHYLNDMEKYGNIREFVAKSHEPPNTFPISSIPWVSFAAFNLNIYTEGTYLLPIFTMGKYSQQDGRILLPLSVQLHHAVCDGYHAGVFFNELQERADDCNKWLADQTIV